MISRPVAAVCLLAFLSFVSGCSKPEGGAEGKPDKLTKVTGAGATFPFPLYSKWMDEYRKVKPSVQINYQSIGSGGGIRQVIAGTVDFGATDVPMTAEEAAQAPRKLVHLPMALGAVVVVYNFPDDKQKKEERLQIAPDVLADIYLGKITQWNDSRLGETNPNLKLPDMPIRVVARSDGSGTSHIFADYLSAVSEDWKGKVGVGKSIRWPVGLGAKGNEGVAGQVRITPGAIGYVELAYAQQTQLRMAAVKNAEGKFVVPSPDSVYGAAEAMPLPDSLVVSLVNAESFKAYPISSYTYLLVYEDNPDPIKGQALSEFLWWAIHDGQKHAEQLLYAPLPPLVVAKVEGKLKELRSQGKTMLASP